MFMDKRHRTYLFLFALITCFYTACAGDQKSPEIHIVYSGSINGALDDCRCGGPVVGGMTRMLTVIDSLRKQYPNMILLDAGDFLNSYSIPGANKVMLRLLSLARYNALNLGDQEFVEGRDFIFSENRTAQLKLPFISANLQDESSRDLLSLLVKTMNISGVKVDIIGLTTPASFEFIHPQKLVANAVDSVLTGLKNKYHFDSGIQIILFHGDAGQAAALIQKFPWIDVVIMAHEQKQQFFQKNNTAVAETGGDGEYIGHLIVRRNGNSLIFKNDFIPILEDLPVNSLSKKIVDDYFQSIRQKSGVE